MRIECEATLTRYGRLRRRKTYGKLADVLDAFYQEYFSLDVIIDNVVLDTEKSRYVIRVFSIKHRGSDIIFIFPARLRKVTLAFSLSQT